ncbi:carbohydrate kinase [Sanghuangporus baumii]|uniref:Gluconokinase n=1 Tax=Sanghuangporus baumii TaxID=108892 RepID=A0A9Q5HSC7_SANBA|nr:carbohydrate kinase [Sanghuangporus baumii]
MVTQNGIDHPQLDALRTEKEHHLHHERGDVGGQYHDQEDIDGIRIGDEHFKAAEKATRRQEAAELSREKDEEKPAEPVLVVVMGVSGCGKSTLGAALAHTFGIPFVDADSLHPKSNVDKMSNGIPLTDEDRQPWLERVRAEALRAVKEQSESHSQESAGRTLKGIVVGCSALKRSYRDVLRGFNQGRSAFHQPNSEISGSSSALPTYFVHIRGSRDALMKRMEIRKGHFMKAGMLESQLQTLEPPEETGEQNVVTVDLEKSMDEQIEQAKEGLRKLGLRV